LIFASISGITLNPARDAGSDHTGETMNVRTYNQLKPWKPKALRGCYLACAWLAGEMAPPRQPDSKRRIRSASPPSSRERTPHSE
jgi:hypothetical protein